MAALHDELALPAPVCAADAGLTDRRVDQLAEHLEQQLFGAGAGEVGRTKLFVVALLERPAVKLLLQSHETRSQRDQKVAMKMLDSAKQTLAHLTTGKRGSRSHQDHERFEAIVAALTPEGASGERLISSIERLLGIHHEQIERGQKRKEAMADDGTAGAFARATKISRAQRKDYRGWGRRLAIEYWHKATRLDTNVGKKRRNREVNPITGKVFYREHWRHVQYDTDAQIADDFFKSVDYMQYLKDGGRPFGRDVFLQAKCFCIQKSDFQECACPTCTLMRENVRGWHQQRPKWHRDHDKDGAAPCSCGLCAKGSAFREASFSLGKLREFIHAPCGKQAFPELAIQAGPKKTEATVQLWRRQCCRAPLPGEACPHRKPGDKSKEACKECSNCSNCSWEKAMPSCPIEYSNQADAEWKEYRPRIEADGKLPWSK